jgi:hypothetical protein
VRRRSGAAAVAAALAALALPTGGASAATPACIGSQLAGNFVVIMASAGAGSISYRLNVRLASGRACVVSGHPRIKLLSRLRQPLPTKDSMRVTLRPGAAAFLAPVRPPTPVCEHGTMAFSALSSAP